MTEEVITRANKDTTDLAEEQDTSQVVWYEVWSKLQAGGFLQLLDESAWQSPRLQSDAGVQPSLDPCQASFSSCQQEMEVFLAYRELTLSPLGSLERCSPPTGQRRPCHPMSCLQKVHFKEDVRMS